MFSSYHDRDRCQGLEIHWHVLCSLVEAPYISEPKAHRLIAQPIQRGHLHEAEVPSTPSLSFDVTFAYDLFIL